MTYSRDAALTLLLGAVCVLPGCIDPKTVGLETEAGSSGASGDTGIATDGMTSQGPTAGSATAGGETDGSETDGSETEGAETMGTGGPCPPISHADCVECECLDGEWACSNAGCNYDCQDDACGEACMMCPGGGDECTLPENEGICTATGECVPIPPPKGEFCEGALQPGFEATLSVVSGCSDMYVFAHDPGDTQGLVLQIDLGLVADAVAMGMPTNTELQATDAGVTLEARAGADVTVEVCNDVGGAGDVDELWLPTAGTISVDLVPTMGMEALATVQITDLVLEREQPGPEPIVVPSVLMSDVLVGWLPG